MESAAGVARPRVWRLAGLPRGGTPTVAALIRLSEVSKRYAAGRPAALDQVNMRVAAGEAVAVMGPSGSGKSTLLNLIAGLDKPTSGTITVAGQRIDSLSETKLARYRRTQVGMIFQFFNLLDDMTVADNVLLPAQLAGVPRRKARARCGELLAQLGIASSRSWLFFVELNSQPNVNTPFVLAFAVLGLVLAVLITANVVSAAVIASYRRIGVLKSIGFTPAQVTAAYLAQIGVPALAGAVAGTALGNWQVLPAIGLFPVDGEHLSVPAWINITVPLGMLALTGLAAVVLAVRAGRLPAVAVIAAGQAPRAGRGYAAHRQASRLALPRPVTIGLGAPFSRPARSAVTLAALTFGLAGVVLAASLNASIHKINHSSLQGLGQVQADYRGGHLYTLTPGQTSKILAALRAQPGTLRYVAETDLRTAPRLPHAPRLGSWVTVGVAGRPGLPLGVFAYDGDSSWLGWNIITGRWYQGPHEVDATPAFLAATGRAVGDSITLTVNGKPVTARIAGEVFTPGGGAGLFTSWQALGGAAAGLAANFYDIALKPGARTASYLAALTHALGPGYLVYTPDGVSIAGQIDTSFFHLLALLVAILAGLGVLNSVLMATRERVHDLGVFKAVGMTPRQILAMVLCWVAAPTIVAAAIALPAGLITQDILVRQLAAAVNMMLPASFVHVLGAADLLLLALAGLGIAILGALGPATWAATSKTTTALRAE
jgi:putative ABC transport system permease protein